MSFLKKSLILVAIACLFLPEANAQKKRGDGVLGAVAGVTALAAVGLEYHLLLEQLENQAANHILSNYPQYESFRLKVLDLDGKKLSDVGAMSVVTFRITNLEKSTGEEKERSVLMMFTSKGWVNQNGVDFSLVSWKLYQETSWNEIFLAFVQLSSPASIDEVAKDFAYSEKISQSEFDTSNSSHYQIDDSFYQINEEVKFSLSETKYTKKGLEAFVPIPSAPSGGRYELALPFYKLKNDDYLVSDFSDEFKLVANERAMGLFFKATGEFVQLQRSVVTKIHDFLNKTDL